MQSMYVATSFTHIFKSFDLFIPEGHTEHSSGLKGKESHPLHFPNSPHNMNTNRWLALETAAYIP